MLSSLSKSIGIVFKSEYPLALHSVVSISEESIKSSKKKTNKSKKTDKKDKKDKKEEHNIVDDSDNEGDISVGEISVGDLLDNYSKTVHYDPSSKSIIENTVNENEELVECIMVKGKNWVFKTSDDDLEYLGIYNGKVVVEGHTPQEIIAAMAAE